MCVGCVEVLVEAVEVVEVVGVGGWVGVGVGVVGPGEANSGLKRSKL